MYVNIDCSTSDHDQTWVQPVQKLTMMAFQLWSKLVAGDTQGRRSLVAEGSNAHRIKHSFLNFFLITLEINDLRQYRVVVHITYKLRILDNKPCVYVHIPFHPTDPTLEAAASLLSLAVSHQS